MTPVAEITSTDLNQLCINTIRHALHGCGTGGLDPDTPARPWR